MSKIKKTYSLDHAVVEKLPKKNQSAVVNQILISHFQNEGFDALYQKIKRRLERETGGAIPTFEVQPQMDEIVSLDSLPTPTGPITPQKPEHLEGEDVYWDKFQQRWRERVYE